MAGKTQVAVSPLPFGIPQLDGLLGYRGIDGINREGCTRTPTSLAIVGSDGTGKSVFALHAASTYLSLLHYQNTERQARKSGAMEPFPWPLVFYISSDLRFQAANKIWENFYLDYPWHRYIPFLPESDITFRREELRDRVHSLSEAFKVPLRQCGPGYEELTAYLKGHRCNRHRPWEDQHSVAFLDLAAHTTGDDWLFVARLLASNTRSMNAPPHLLILDSVAGFETLVGELNSFGERMSRRARVAQLIRAAGDNWHTVFIVEEPNEGSHLPEEYVTDTVLHLRRHGRGEHTRRFLEIEKSRARSFGVGEHPFEIRDGRGSSTGGWENPDDPHTMVHPDFWRHLCSIPGGDPGRQRHNAYVQVFPSLHYLSREFSRSRILSRSADNASDQAPIEGAATNLTGSKDYVRFNITYLDNMLARAGNDCGLPGGSITALVGDEGTRKATLAEYFLAQAFVDLPQILEAVIDVVNSFKSHQRDVSGSYRYAHIDEYLEAQAEQWKRHSSGDWRVNTYPILNRLWTQIEHNIRTFPHRRDELRELEVDCWTFREERSLWSDVEGKEGSPLKTRWDAKYYYERIDHPAPPGVHTLILALSVLRMSWGLLPAVVFVSTHDTSSEKISAMIERLILRSPEVSLEAILKDRCGFGKDDKHTDANQMRNALAAVKRLLERFILVRRVELVDATAPQLWHIVHSSVTHALYLLGHPINKVVSSTVPLEYASDVRVVLSDLRLVRDTYPAVANDPLFLPTLSFRLKRLGVTTLIVDSDNGRPDQHPSHPMNGALRSLVDHQIYTWKVPFFGEQRVAIAVIPAMNTESRGVIRELCHIRTGVKLENEVVTVDPHFELYMGLEEGRPTAVPLQVILYEETKAFAEYIQSEGKFLSRVFSPLPGEQAVIQVQPTRDYDGLRDYCHLPIGTHLHHTLVFMVDGYWALGRETLRSQRDYLFAPLIKFDDSFRLYQSTLQHGDEGATVPGHREKHDEVRHPPRRIDFFSQPDSESGVFFYKSRLSGQPKNVDRVPFMWDFGFLLCSEHQWNSAAAIPITARDPSTDKPYTVGEIWQRLCRIEALEVNRGRSSKTRAPSTVTLGVQAILGDPILEKGDAARNVSWREFLEAARAVASAEQRRSGGTVLGFDLAMATPESFTCWMIEMWFSEMLNDALLMCESIEVLRQQGEPNDATLIDRARTWVNKLYVELRVFSQSEYEHAGPDRWYLQNYLRGARRSIGKDLQRMKRTVLRMDDATPVARARRVVTMFLESPGYSLQLYKTWLLMLEAVDFGLYEDSARPFSLKADFEPSTGAVSTRHWYKTACAASERDRGRQIGENVVRTKVPVRLPGFFTTRGDWFLGVAQGSRSSRLADQALDMLTSRRANRTRLHLGLGLPTRDLLQGRSIREIRTALTISTPDGVHNVNYGHLLDLGGKFVVDKYQNNEMPKVPAATSYFWFYRSGFKDYDRQAVAVQRWIQRLMSWTIRYRDLHRATWREHTGFLTYDEIQCGDLSKVHTYNSFLEFAYGLDTFVADLDHCSLTPDTVTYRSSTGVR
jgi:KaiC/GvpD/RAD55 family RecA-like ATPase